LDATEPPPSGYDPAVDPVPVDPAAEPILAPEPPAPAEPFEPLPEPVEPTVAPVEEPPAIAATESAGAAGTAAAAQGVPAPVPTWDPVGEPAPAGASPASAAGELDLGDRPEIYVGAAFAGGLVFAGLLRWLSRRG